MSLLRWPSIFSWNSERAEQREPRGRFHSPTSPIFRRPVVASDGSRSLFISLSLTGWSLTPPLEPLYDDNDGVRSSYLVL